jgi:hypothetical protein
MKTQTEHQINLNEKELRTVLRALGKLPFEEVYELIEKLVLYNAEQQKSTPKIKK